MAITSAALIFFNYLIGLFWLAFILAKYFTGSPKPRFLDLLKTQKFAIATFAICGVLFYPPGQGLRSVTSLPTFASDFYYTVLNYFSWYNQSILFDRLQFLAGLLILVCSFIYLIRAAGKKELIPATLIFIWIIYLAAALFKVLGFGPIRQMLFLSPAIFFAAGAMLGRILPAAEKTPAKILVWAFLIFIPAAGFFTVSLRHKAAADISKNLAVDADVTKIGIHDCSFNWLYKKWPSRAQVDFINPKSLNKNDTVLYLSQTIPFQTAMQSWQKNWQIDYNILSSQNLITGTYFMAYNPSLERFGFTRPNNVYEVKFKVNQITPK